MELHPASLPYIDTAHTGVGLEAWDKVSLQGRAKVNLSPRKGIPVGARKRQVGHMCTGSALKGFWFHLKVDKLKKQFFKAIITIQNGELQWMVQ